MRLPLLLSDLLTRGPLFAIANYRIHSPVELDSVENWRFWTKPRSNWIKWLLRAYPPKQMRVAFLSNMLAPSHASGIEAHYDISNDFYALFLDRKYRFYTCAEFQEDNDTLEEAQTRKAEHLRSLLNLRGSETILELGCGWGSMLKFLKDSGHRGKLAGLTLSKAQLRYGRDELGFDVSLANFVTDPIEHESCDRILSVGALEHVRPSELEQMYQKIYDALVPGGRAVHQFFSLLREELPTSMVAVQLFFPGSLLVMHLRHLEIAKRIGFEIIHDSVHDYRPTLKVWYDRLVSQKTRALQLVGLGTFNRFMTFFPYAWLFFEEREADVHRIVMVKPAR